MDIEAQRTKLTNDLRAVDAWLEAPITKAVMADVAVEIEKATHLLCDVPVTDIESFFAHFTAAGHLRGLRYLGLCVHEHKEVIQDKLNAIP